MPLCLFLLFHWSKRQKTDVRASLSKTRRTFTLRSRWKKRPQEHQEDGPVQQESKEFMNPPAQFCTADQGESGVRHPPQHLRPRRPSNPASPPPAPGCTVSLGLLTFGGPVPRRRHPSPRRPSSAPLPSSRLPPRPRSPGPGKLASVVTITNSIVLSRAPANKVIHYGPIPAAVGCAAGRGPPAAPSRAETRANAGTCRGRARGTTAATLCPRPRRGRAGGVSAGRRLVLSRHVN